MLLSHIIAFQPKILLSKTLKLSMSTESIRVISYNVLSSHLGGADYYTKCNPAYLDPTYRKEQVLKKLTNEVNQNSIICLQELSINWQSEFHKFFINNDYYMISNSYGKKFNGYMGVAIAFPIKLYNLLDCDITTISDYIYIPKEKKKSENFLISFIKRITKRFRKSDDLFNPWLESQYRKNQMICVILKNKNNLSKGFIIGTYHMPCLFDKPQVMTIHTLLSAQHIEKISKQNNLPYIYCGDFNSKPDSSMYKLITTGEIDDKDPAKPLPLSPIEIKLSPMNSAYALKNSVEPTYTNYAQVKEQDAFIGTLDYIFMSKEFKVENVIDLPNIENTKGNGPMPLENEPSDHLLIGATLSLDT